MNYQTQYKAGIYMSYLKDTWEESIFAALNSKWPLRKSERWLRQNDSVCASSQWIMKYSAVIKCKFQGLNKQIVGSTNPEECLY